MYLVIGGIFFIWLGFRVLSFNTKIAKWRLGWDVKILKGAFNYRLKKDKVNLFANRLHPFVLGLTLILLGFMMILTEVGIISPK